jgi:hypothetical protein
MTIRNRQHRVRDYVLYISISFAIVAIVTTGALTRFSRGWGEWIALPIFTLLLFYYWLTICRTLWRKRSFWRITFLLFLLHVAAWTIVIRKLDPVKPTGFLAIEVIPEFALFVWFSDLLNKFLHREDSFNRAPHP